MSNFRIRPSKAPFTQGTSPFPLFVKKNVEVWLEHFCSRLNNIDQGKVGEGVIMVPNSQGESPLSKKVQNSLTLFVQDCGSVMTTGLLLNEC